MAFIFSAKPSSGNKEVNTASVSTASTNVSTASSSIGAASISQDTACAYIASQSNEEDQRMSEQIARDAEVEYEHILEDLSIREMIELISDMESAKKLKTREEVPKEVKATEEVPEEKVKEMMQLVPIEENLMHAPIEWKLYNTYGVHHVTSKDKEISMLVEKDYLLRKGLAIIMISYKLQVENYSQMENDLILKIYKIAVVQDSKMIEGILSR
nr:hypothetical protein [Tanacetum cinerariifolium]